MVNKRLSTEAPPNRGGGGEAPAPAPEKNEGNGRSSSEGERLLRGQEEQREKN